MLPLFIMIIYLINYRLNTLHNHNLKMLFFLDKFIISTMDKFNNHLLITIGYLNGPDILTPILLQDYYNIIEYIYLKTSKINKYNMY